MQLDYTTFNYDNFKARKITKYNYIIIFSNYIIICNLTLE